MHQCKTHEEWLLNTHYYCPCGHVEWAHYKNGICAHCNCTSYKGEDRPLTEFEKKTLNLSNLETELEIGKSEQMKEFAKANNLPIIEITKTK